MNRKIYFGLCIFICIALGSFVNAGYIPIQNCASACENVCAWSHTSSTKSGTYGYCDGWVYCSGIDIRGYNFYSDTLGVYGNCGTTNYENYNYQIGTDGAGPKCYKAYLWFRNVYDASGCPGDWIVGEHAMTTDTNSHRFSWSSVTGNSIQMTVSTFPTRYISKMDYQFADLSSHGGGAMFNLYCLDCADGKYLTNGQGDYINTPGRCCEGTATFNNPGANNPCCYKGSIYASGTSNDQNQLCSDGVWGNCNDNDEDGYYLELGCGTPDCDDTNANIHPGAGDIPCNYIDEDCSGYDAGTDKDGDGFKLEGGLCGEIDCDDSNKFRFPGSTEHCDNYDNDCDNEVDENCLVAKSWHQITELEGYKKGDISTVTAFEEKDNLIKIVDNNEFSYGISNIEVTISDPGSYTCTATVYCISGNINLAVNANGNIKSSTTNDVTGEWSELKTNVDLDNNDVVKVMLHTGAETTSECYVDNVKLFKGDIEFPLEVTAETPLAEKSCCPKAYCWNGIECVPSVPFINAQSNPKSFNIAGVGSVDWQSLPQHDRFGPDAFICYNNESNAKWTNGYIKYSYDYEASPVSDNYGICIDSNQCYRSGHCVFNGEFFGDHYCENGAWTSRTKLLGEKMLELAGSDYDIFCDEYNSALNRPQYTVDDTDTLTIIKGTNLGTTLFPNFKCVANYPGEESELPCTNNYCILETDNKVYLGTSFNFPIDDPNNKFLLLIEKNCDSALESTDANYHQCSGDTWYNLATNSMIHSKETFILTSEMSAGEIFINIFVHPILTLTSLLKPTKEQISVSGIADVPVEISFANATRDYKVIYRAEQGDMEVTGVKESISSAQEYYHVIFKNFKTNVCDRAKELGLSCKITVDTALDYPIYNVVTTKDLGNLASWKDLTAKLRLKGITKTGTTPDAQIIDLPEQINISHELRLEAQTNENIVDYYWDITPSEGNIVSEVSGFNRTVILEDYTKTGTTKVQLIVIGTDGKYKIASKEICAYDDETDADKNGVIDQCA
ncbi:putative metal-binding motif-containing protein [Candidatus Woesearchaeota archaeon]|nr:putative metal-binding motif-containing protein [Candidatus Woesearchaeota archaeon]MBW3021584.1 putative metal-binding motif-containing protein [Candidatus Woesearchaeota archaeon]